MKRTFFIVGLLCIAVIGGVILPDHVIGQLSGRSPIPQESLRGIQGETFEILPLHSLPNPRFSWILMQDRKFIDRAESSVFRTRLSEVGTYTLNVEMTSADGGTKVRRMFNIDVKQPTAESPEKKGDVLVTLTPQAEGQTIILSNGQSTVLLSPTKKTQILSIDRNPDLDTNADGNPKNDNDAAGTSFSTEGSPLYLWFISPISSQSVIVYTDTGEIQEFVIASPEFMKMGEKDSGNVHIHAELSSGKNMVFTAEFVEGQKPESPLLFHWDFGDGKESLLENPTHQYAVDSEYDIQLTIRNLESGIILMNTKKKITVKESIPEEKSTGGKIFSGRIFVIGGSIVGLFFFLGGASILLMRFVRKKVQSPLKEESAQKSTKKSEETKEEESEEIPHEKQGKPMESSVEDLVEDHERSRGEHGREKQNQEEENSELTEDVQNIVNAEEEAHALKEKSEEEKGVTPPGEELPPLDMTNAPAWLQKGLDVPIGSQKTEEETPLNVSPSGAFDGATPLQPQEPQTQENVSPEPTPEPPLYPPSDVMTPSAPTPEDTSITPITEPYKQPAAIPPPSLQESLPTTKPSSPQSPVQSAVNTPQSNLPAQTPKKRRRRRPRNRNRLNGPAPAMTQGNIPTQGPPLTPKSDKKTPLLEQPPTPLPATPIPSSSKEKGEKIDDNEPVAFIQVDSIPNTSESPSVQEKGNAMDEEIPEEESGVVGTPPAGRG